MQDSPSVNTQAAEHAVTTAEHTIQSPELQLVFSQCSLHPPSQLQQKMLQAPLPQHPKSAFREQQSAQAPDRRAAKNTMAKTMDFIFI
jgi:hypothetical protein